MARPITDPSGGVQLFWIPLGAGGSGLVRLSGRIYEARKARRQERSPCPLYHTALQVLVPEGRFVVETMWPSPDPDFSSRGVVLEGPVISPVLGRIRMFRYEVRRWREGVLPDASGAIGGPQLVTREVGRAREILRLVEEVPNLVWGRDQLGAGEMWNSNSVVSWLLARGGIPVGSLLPPAGGRAPGWQAGIAAAGLSSLPGLSTSCG
ncbi:MAG: hypothetical protein ACLFWM_03340 [Actinomycetota bacterium]